MSFKEGDLHERVEALEEEGRRKDESIASLLGMVDAWHDLGAVTDAERERAYGYAGWSS